MRLRDVAAHVEKRGYQRPAVQQRELESETPSSEGPNPRRPLPLDTNRPVDARRDARKICPSQVREGLLSALLAMIPLFCPCPIFPAPETCRRPRSPAQVPIRESSSDFPPSCAAICPSPATRELCTCSDRLVCGLPLQLKSTDPISISLAQIALSQYLLDIGKTR